MAKPSDTKLGVTLTAEGAEFAVWSRNAERIELCLFDEWEKRETGRHRMIRGRNDIHRVTVKGILAGQRYGYRAWGAYNPDQGLWFDPSKVLVDPYARQLDRPFQYNPKLAMYGVDSADLMPKTIVTHDPLAKIGKPKFAPGGFIYEVAVRPFTVAHPEVPEKQRGTVAALAHPSVIDYLKKLGIDAIELMPITAWIDERHLPPLGLTNGWGYNPVAFMALDPRLCPGGVKELRDTVEALHKAGIGVILDLVFNHTGESDRQGPTLSLRGLDNRSYYRHVADEPGRLVNDTGTGNTVACDLPPVSRLIIDSLRHFVLHAGVDGFRFDLAPVLGRTPDGFDAKGAMLKAMLADEALKDRVLIAEPWDIGPGGYQLGNFPAPFLEWNDRARDDIRRYWRGDRQMVGALATRLAGSSDIFEKPGATDTKTRTVNFLAAHDGFTLADLVSYEKKHNEANGENNRDGHDENLSWNNGVEGETGDIDINEARRRDIAALLTTLFVSRGTIMLTMGDEAGRSQRGNNNAYCQDNALTWFNWQEIDNTLVEHTATLVAIRRRFAVFSDTTFFTGKDDVAWLAPTGEPMQVGDWENPDNPALGMILKTLDRETGKQVRLAVLFNRSQERVSFGLLGWGWRQMPSGELWNHVLPPRAVRFCIEG